MNLQKRKGDNPVVSCYRDHEPGHKDHTDIGPKVLHHRIVFMTPGSNQENAALARMHTAHGVRPHHRVPETRRRGHQDHHIGMANFMPVPQQAPHQDQSRKRQDHRRRSVAEGPPRHAHWKNQDVFEASFFHDLSVFIFVFGRKAHPWKNVRSSHPGGEILPGNLAGRFSHGGQGRRR